MSSMPPKAIDTDWSNSSASTLSIVVWKIFGGFEARLIGPTGDMVAMP